ncbi:hypothetical protein SEA_REDWATTLEHOG_93 [Gordonia phage RedWattleHog]|uniref:Uncharacterized protein n=1 Tax=Gordonia phage Stormageddon TaxID=2656541 RepID=A0A649VSN8_9CAUD|nr:hypothetical protein KHQ86_gp210 [Gordonia phage Stormageddon]QGJ94952.1 hypothetical protein SEA_STORMAGEDDON_90 [Gordonia phage Stormageddon]QLF83596.1 hypothetical protein SEA_REDWATTLEHOG_93 [Gordonia phage RedWattleHog]
MALGEMPRTPVWMAVHTHRSGRTTVSVGYSKATEVDVQYAPWWPNEVSRTLYNYEDGLPVPQMGWGRE